MKPVRCAIYTRKSSDEGLEQGFNSLDAQHEACAAYILSQAGEGWTALPERYDDGGISGGTLERPALRRLMADMAAGRIDIVVVYKVDRLSRSLFDFAKLVEAFEKTGTSFVSITQAFNTTSSMGRLTLNMLLSFAQFEREVTAERIRDKIAASKAKGMWMGGIPPVGYAPDGRSLAIIEDHAALVRTIFQRYLALGNVRLLEAELSEMEITAPARTLITGKPIGARPFSRGQLYKMLRCPTYVGEVHHGGKTYQGLQQAIIDRDMWEQVQARLAENRAGDSYTRAPRAALFAGRIVDETGAPLVPVHTSKGKVRYSYYVSHALQHGSGGSGIRMPARDLEAAVCETLAVAVEDPLTLMERAGLDVAANDIAGFAARARQLGSLLRQREPERVRPLIAMVQLIAKGLEIEVDTTALATALTVTPDEGATPTLRLTVPVRLTRSGRAMRLIQGGSRVVDAQSETALIRLLGQAQLYWRALREGEIDVTRLAQREGISPAYVTRVLRLAFLSPEVVKAMLTGRQRAGLTATALVASDAVAPCWQAQAKALLAG
ncbi:recombinase family protein [uncultured Sphingomonas sp.]|uniref:recombinase family protein n=1 Tax=uncultured Sphingomonas sp. TaxID=158754 RepID=UPI0025FA0BD8|nr:recombinase family protein [uncultured Sphingomonas sp.]